MATTTVTLGFTKSDRAADYCSYDDGYRPGAAQYVVTVTVTGPTSTLTLDEWAEAMFCASNAPAYPDEHPVVEAARAALADAQWDGARLRSLSIGDTVTVGGRTVACDKGSGWKPVSLTDESPVLQAAAVYTGLREAATSAYRAVVASPGDRELQVAYGRALAALAPFYASQAQAHAAVGALVTEADRFAFHVHYVHRGVAAECACPAGA